jgi:hypothetical protein
VLEHIGVTEKMTDVDGIDEVRLEKSEPEVILLVERDDQKKSLHQPIRKQILRVLSMGIDDFDIEVRREVEALEDGTELTRHVEAKRPIRRYWITVPEIVEALQRRYPKSKVTNHHCYYHLQILQEQGLVHQDPPLEFDGTGKKRRNRGTHYRAAAKIFLSNVTNLSPENPSPILHALDNGWGANLSDEDGEQLGNLLVEQEKALFAAFEHLARHLSDSRTEHVTLPIIIEKLAHVHLACDEEFIERYRNLREILVRSCGDVFTTDDNCENLSEGGAA